MSRTHLILHFPGETHVTSNMLKCGFSLFFWHDETTECVCFSLARYQPPFFCGSHLKPSVAGDKQYKAARTCCTMKTKLSLWSLWCTEGFGGVAIDKTIDPWQLVCVCVCGGRRGGAQLGSRLPVQLGIQHQKGVVRLIPNQYPSNEIVERSLE